jgi:pectate lyase
VGGTAATGGTASGGANNTGGHSSSGGALPTGGVAATGGKSAIAGAVATGGTTTTTGGAPTGGALATAGSKATGGVAPTGGASTAGNKATGGVTATGGSSGNGVCPETNELVGWATQSGTVTGGGNLTPTVVTTLSALNTAAAGTNAAVIQVSGTISGNVTIGSNKTLIGACGNKATISGHIQMSGSQNVIMRNLYIVGYNCTDSPSDCSAGDDAITVVTSAKHLWFDHCDVSDGSDGNLDMTHASDFITISWTKFHYSGRRSGDHQFCNLIGHDDGNASEDTGHLNVTFDHVWWADNVAQRMPRVRFGKVHVINSLYTASGNDTAIGEGVNCNVRIENNIFKSITSVFYDQGNAASIVQSIGNTFTSSTSTTPLGGTAFQPPYTIALESLTTLEASVRAGAGPH